MSNPTSENFKPHLHRIPLQRSNTKKKINVERNWRTNEQSNNNNNKPRKKKVGKKKKKGGGGRGQGLNGVNNLHKNENREAERVRTKDFFFFFFFFFKQEKAEELSVKQQKQQHENKKNKKTIKKISLPPPSPTNK